MREVSSPIYQCKGWFPHSLRLGPARKTCFFSEAPTSRSMALIAWTLWRRWRWRFCLNWARLKNGSRFVWWFWRLYIKKNELFCMTSSCYIQKLRACKRPSAMFQEQHMQQIGMAAGHILKLRIGLFDDTMQQDSTWRIIRCSSWLIAMVISFCPLRIGLWDPFQMDFKWLVNRGDPNYLQVLGWSSKYAPSFRVLSFLRQETPGRNEAEPSKTSGAQWPRHQSQQSLMREIEALKSAER